MPELNLTLSQFEFFYGKKIHWMSEIVMSRLQTVLKSGHFCVPNSDRKQCSQSGQKCPDFRHSTKLGCFVKGS